MKAYFAINTDSTIFGPDSNIYDERAEVESIEDLRQKTREVFARAAEKPDRNNIRVEGKAVFPTLEGLWEKVTVRLSQNEP